MQNRINAQHGVKLQRQYDRPLVIVRHGEKQLQTLGFFEMDGVWDPLDVSQSIDKPDNFDPPVQVAFAHFCSRIFGGDTSVLWKPWVMRLVLDGPALSANISQSKVAHLWFSGPSWIHIYKCHIVPHKPIKHLGLEKYFEGHLTFNGNAGLFFTSGLKVGPLIFGACNSLKPVIHPANLLPVLKSHAKSWFPACSSLRLPQSSETSLKGTGQLDMFKNSLTSGKPLNIRSSFSSWYAWHIGSSIGSARRSGRGLWRPLGDRSPGPSISLPGDSTNGGIWLIHGVMKMDIYHWYPFK